MQKSGGSVIEEPMLLISEVLGSNPCELMYDFNFYLSICECLLTIPLTVNENTEAKKIHYPWKGVKSPTRIGPS